MKKSLLTLFTAIITFHASAGGVPVIDWTAILQAMIQVALTSNLVSQSDQMLNRMGDPAAISQIAGALQTTTQLAKQGVGQSLKEIQLGTTGDSGQSYDGNGLYKPVETTVAIAGGQTLTRPPENYRKHEAVQKMIADYNAVVTDTKARRDTLREAQLQTTEQLKAAGSDAEVQKLKGILQSQEAELATVSAERVEAAQKVLVQQASNEADTARHQQAADEDRAASLQSALVDSLKFFQPDSATVTIPNPKTVNN